MTAAEHAPAIAISATFTAEPVEESLRFWIEELGWRDTVRFAPFNQVFQQLLDPTSLLAANADGVNVLLVRLRDWLPAGGAAGDVTRQFAEAVRSAAARWSVPLLVVFCPEPERDAAANLRAELAAVSTVHVVTSEELLKLYPVAEVHDPHSDELGRVPYTPLLFAALGTLLARKINALRMTPFKVCALDCDDTLWRGVCGEDGPEGVTLDAPRQALQEFMLRQHEAGLLLCLASKNNVEEVLETFRVHPEMPLRLQNFVSHRINWDSKGHNLRGLAEEMQLGLDSFVFVDDNPKECREAQAACPEILALALPADEREIPAFLEHVWAFDRLRITEEDRRRAAMYALEMERHRLERQSASLEGFLASLRLEVRIETARPGQFARIAQLTQRTNQMNFTTRRRGESEIREFLRASGECLTVEVEDRFGSYGLTGAVLFACDAEALKIDTFLLSCRVLGRGVEHYVLRHLGRMALDRGLKRVEAPFATSARNRPALLFLENAGGRRYQQPREGGQLFAFPAGIAAALEYRPVNGRPAEPGPKAAAAAPVRADYERIARELRTAEAILERIRKRKSSPASAIKAGQAPGAEIEREIRALWAELLGVATVNANDSFFDLGGHSLMAVELLARVRRRFGADLSLEVVYTGEFTPAALARAVELKEIEQAVVAGYDDLLKEVEGLSDEEVRALLAREETPPVES
ncbi:MAG: HAD-IIIC family phosphatase [Acidobacteria bacterium]|nr:HAD-IIIC family phosphatase [Acidobacteriota bacterium]